jgi:hypothetical protein
VAETDSEFMMPTSPESLESLRDITDVLVGRFGLSRAEAVARVNRAWGDQDLASGPDLLGHEDPEHWARGLHGQEKPNRGGERDGWDA